MADETKSKVPEEQTTNISITRSEDHTVERMTWVAFEGDSEVPLLPKPPILATDMSSENYINRLEEKLHHMKDPWNITSKNIVSTLSEVRQCHMSNMLSDTCPPISSSSNRTSNDEEICESNCCFSCYSSLFPKQARTLQELECLIDEDELAILTSEQLEDNRENNQTIPG